MYRQQHLSKEYHFLESLKILGTTIAVAGPIVPSNLQKYWKWFKYHLLRACFLPVMVLLSIFIYSTSHWGKYYEPMFREEDSEVQRLSTITEPVRDFQNFIKGPQFSNPLNSYSSHSPKWTIQYIRHRGDLRAQSWMILS